jgi:hypothetical protein
MEQLAWRPPACAAIQTGQPRAVPPERSAPATQADAASAEAPPEPAGVSPMAAASAERSSAPQAAGAAWPRWQARERPIAILLQGENFAPVEAARLPRKSRDPAARHNARQRRSRRAQASARNRYPKTMRGATPAARRQSKRQGPERRRGQQWEERGFGVGECESVRLCRVAYRSCTSFAALAGYSDTAPHSRHASALAPLAAANGV